MKIRLRLALLSILCSALSLIVCGTLLMRASAKSSIQSVQDNALAELSILNTSFSSAVSAANGTDLTETGKRSLVVYVFRSYAESSLGGSKYALALDGKTLFNNSGYALDILLLNNTQREVALGSTRLFITTTKTTLMHEDYQIYLMRDVTAVYDSIAKLRIQFVAICCGALLMSAAVILLVTFRALRRLKTLEAGAAAMANGNFNMRIPIHGHDEITALSESFNQMANSVEQHINTVTATAEERKMLLGALTHELKTPMTAIIGYAESLERARLNELQKATAISYIFLESKRLERLTQKMMRLITLTDGEDIECRVVQARELFTIVEETLFQNARQQGVSLHFSDNGAQYTLDSDLMASVLINLVDNACAAGAKNITVQAVDKMLAVSDDGCGISAEIIDRVTQPFFMADKARSRKRGSVGLGLALVSRIVKLHHATLEMKSVEGHGTDVIILFPQ